MAPEPHLCFYATIKLNKAWMEKHDVSECLTLARLEVEQVYPALMRELFKSVVKFKETGEWDKKG